MSVSEKMNLSCLKPPTFWLIDVFIMCLDQSQFEIQIMEELILFDHIHSPQANIQITFKW